MLHMYQKTQPYEVRFLRYGVRQTEYFSFWTIFLPSPRNNPENKNFEKMRNASADVVILHMFTKIQDHMMFASCDMKCDRQNFWSFWIIFCPFTQLFTPKIKI